MEQVIERVVGPYRGYFIAAYAYRQDERKSESIAYFKLCLSPPESYFNARTCFLKGYAGLASGVDVALDLAIELGRLRAKSLPLQA